MDIAHELATGPGHAPAGSTGYYELAHAIGVALDDARKSTDAIRRAVLFALVYLPTGHRDSSALDRELRVTHDVLSSFALGEPVARNRNTHGKPKP